MMNMEDSSQQDSLGNMLSAEAKEFVPRRSELADGSEVNGLIPSPGVASIAGPDGAGLPVGADKLLPGLHPASNGLPSYMTTCYPFVSAGDARLSGSRQRLRGRYPQNFPGAPLQPGAPRNRFPHPGPHPGKGYVGSWPHPAITDLYHPFPNIPNGMPFDGGTYQNGFIRPPVSGLVSPLGGQDPKSVMALHTTAFPTSHIADIYSTTDLAKPWKQQISHNPADGSPLVNGIDLDGLDEEPTTVCCKNSSIQTDFSDYLANSTLEDIPNSLFNSHLSKPTLLPPGGSSTQHKSKHKTRKRHKSTTSDADSDCGHVNSIHRKNQVSNGTNPPVNGPGDVVVMETSDFNHNHVTNLSVGSSSMQGTSPRVPQQGTGRTVPSSCDLTSPRAPQQRLSYASIAQGQPSQNKKLSGVAAMVMKVADPTACDTTSSRKVNCNANSSLNNVNVNVAQIMEDLDKAEKAEMESSAAAKVKTKIVPKLKDINIVVKSVPSNSPLSGLKHPSAEVSSSKEGCNSVEIRTGSSVSSAGVNGLTNAVNQLPGGYPWPSNQKASYAGTVAAGNQPFNQVPSQCQQTTNQGSVPSQCQQTTNSDLDKSKLIEGQGQTDSAAVVGEDGEVKKKKRRRRRRKKKGDGTMEEIEEGFAGATDDVTLHFEDEDEFPDLSGPAGGADADARSSPRQPVHLSYSDILRNTNAVQSMQTMVTEDTLQEQTAGALSSGDVPTEKESRNSRKRRRRRESANKAADAEMAEIGLEQHMLELKLKQKHPLGGAGVSGRKSVSPSRGTTSQGVWKLPISTTTTTTSVPAPSSSSSSGKKVSLLLPGTVAPEPVPSSPSVPSNAAPKQHGILKTSQPLVVQPQGGGGGKKSKQPITFDFGAIITAIEAKKEQPPTPKKEVHAVVKKEDVKVANPLDSSAPAKRGKERETPKCKKPSPLKKVILKEREEKKRLRLLDEDEAVAGISFIPVSTFPSSPISAPVGIGVISGESDLSQDASSSKCSMEVGTPASAELSPISQPSPSCMSPMSPGASPLSSGVNSPIGGALQTVKLKIHSRRFREYCNQVLDKEIDNCVTALLTDLVRFQDKQYHKDPVKAKAKRRFVLGLREVTKHLKLRKMKCVIISPNLEKIQSKGGLDDALNSILELCNEQNVPFIFALGRRALGRACAKLVPVSVVGIFNYEGSEENFKMLVSLTEKGREAYHEMILQIEKELQDHPPRATVPGISHNIGIYAAHLGHSRTPSGCSVLSLTSSILSEPISENPEPETDKRGYEIEKDENDLNSPSTSPDPGRSERDPYEADDESGGVKKVKQSASKGNAKCFDGLSNGDEELDDEEDDIDDDDEEEEDEEADDEAENTGDNENSESVFSKDLANNTSLIDLNGSINSSILSEVTATVVNQNSCGESDDLTDDFKDVDDDEDDDFYEKLDDEASNVEELEEKELEFGTCDDLSEVDHSKLQPRYIQSVHHFDLNEILSQHSSKTMENGEDVMSTHSSKTTHSSRTLGESSTHLGDKACKVKIEISNAENANVSIKGKGCADQENRTLSWVKETQNLHFNKDDTEPATNEADTVDINGVTIECLDAIAT